MSVAALYVDLEAGPCPAMDGVECWGLPARDARDYRGPHPVVAHPPCKWWGAMRWQQDGDDGGCFASALAAVRAYGGVLEHPEGTAAFKRYQLGIPLRGVGWQRDLWGGWSCTVDQVLYGHRCRKRTWLYYVGASPPTPLDTRDGTGLASHLVCTGPGCRDRPILPASERHLTPRPFADALVALALEAVP